MFEIQFNQVWDEESSIEMPDEAVAFNDANYVET
jgi:hypothetical protein